MTDWTAIFNQALGNLGSPPISDYLIDPSPRAARLRAVYLAVADEVLQAHPWKCALGRAQLGADATAPLFGPSYSYTVPSDPWCLRPVCVGDPDDEENWFGRCDRWQFEGRQILTDLPAPINVRYIKRLTDPNLFTGLLATAMSRRLAWEIAYALTNSREKEQAAEDAFGKFMQQARSIDSQQGTPPREFPSRILQDRY